MWWGDQFILKNLVGPLYKRLLFISLMKILVKNGTIITQNYSREVIPGGDVLVQDSKIIAVGKNLSGTHADKEIDATGTWVIPGLINVHVHLGETIYAPFMLDRYPLKKYLSITEKMASSSKSIEKGRLSVACYSLLQLLRSGTTTISGGRTSESAELMGMRNVSGYMLMHSRKLGHFSKNFGDKLQYLIFHTNQDLTSHAIFIHSLGRVSKAMLNGVRVFLSKNKDIRLMIHVAENTNSSEVSIKKWGKSEIEILESFSLLNERTLLVHGNLLNRSDLDIIRERGCSIAHCPSSSMNTSDAMLDLYTVLAKGINAVIATDGVVTASDYSVLREAGFAYKYHNRFTPKNLIAPERFFDMITINAALALGLEEKIGSIGEGKEADILIVEPPFEKSIADPVKQLIRYANLIRVRDVIIGGKLMLSGLSERQINGESKTRHEFKETADDVERELND